MDLFKMPANVGRDRARFFLLAPDEYIDEIAGRGHLYFTPRKQAKFIAHTTGSDASRSQAALDHARVAKRSMKAAKILDRERYYRTVKQVETAVNG